MAKDFFYISDMCSGGTNTKDDPRGLPENQSPLMLNMDIRDRGRVISRPGYEVWANGANEADLSGSVTAQGRGLLRYYRTYGTNSGEYLLSFFSNGRAYNSTAADPSLTDLGSFGTDSGAVRGIVYNNTAIFGNGLAGNTVQKYEGGAGIANLGGSPPDSKIFGSINSVLLCVPSASPRVMQWSDAEDPEVWGAGIASNTSIPTKDGGDIKALIEANDQPMALAEYSKHMADMSFDANDLLARFAFKEKVDKSGGCVATGSVQSSVSDSGESVIYLGLDGFGAYGALENFSDKRNPSQISYQIKPTIENVNYSAADVINSEIYKDRYHCLVPVGTSTKNNFAFNQFLETGGWTFYDGWNFADMTKFKGEDGREMLIAQDASSAKLYKIINEFHDDGEGYDQLYRCKTWTFGRRVRWDYINLEGSKSYGKDIYVDVTIDGYTETFRITDDFLLQSSSGGYLGDNWIGDGYIDGSDGEGDQSGTLYRFRVRIKPEQRREGYEMTFDVRNSEANIGFSLFNYGNKIGDVSDEVAKNPYTGGSGYAPKL